MLIVTDMSTGKNLLEPGEEYGEEVLLANWLPRPELLGPGLQEAVAARTGRREPPQDAEALLRAVYLSQE